MAWHYNRSGIFSVRSTYHVQWEHRYGSHVVSGTQGSMTGNLQVWNSLWKLQLPSKIKIFGWRALQGLIPCRSILANKHVGNVGSCPICPSGCEDIKHVIFTCDRAKEVWKSLGVWSRIENILHVDHSVILQEIIWMGNRVTSLNDVVSLN